MLIEAHANVNVADNDGRTALIVAAVAGRTDSVKALLAAHADVNAKTKKGWTALALSQDNSEISTVLKSAVAKN